MNEQRYEQLTLFQEDSLANLSALPGNEMARMMTVTSGLRCSELYEKSSLLGSLVRMCLESSIWHSTKCFLTWKVKAMKHKRLLFRLVASMPRTEGTESLLWPTPVHGHCAGGTGAMQIVLKKLKSGEITKEEYRTL